MRNTVLPVVLASVTWLATLSCSSDDRLPRSPAGSQPAVTPQRSLRLLAETSPQLAAFERIKSQYETTSGVRIEIDRRDAVGGLREDPGPLANYDLLIAPHRLIGQLVERGDVQPIDELLADPALYNAGLFDPHKDGFEGWWPELSWYRGHVYGYPFALLPASLWYREDLFDDEDEGNAFEKQFGRPFTFPKTPSELRQVAEFFYRPQQGLYGTVVHGRSDASLVYEWLAYGAMFGARIFDAVSSDAYGDIVVNSPEAIAATEFLVGLLRFAPADAVNYTERDAVRALERRRIALAVMRHDLAIAGSGDAEVRAGGGIGYLPLPSVFGGGVTVVDGETFLIPRGTVHAREAFALMQWASSHDAQVAQILNGGLSVRPSSFNDPRVTALPKARQSSPYMQIWMFPKLAAPARLVPAPRIVEADQIAEAMSSTLSQVLAGAVAPKNGLDDIAAKLARILKGRAKLRYPTRAGA